MPRSSSPVKPAPLSIHGVIPFPQLNPPPVFLFFPQTMKLSSCISLCPSAPQAFESSIIHPEVPPLLHFYPFMSHSPPSLIPHPPFQITVQRRYAFLMIFDPLLPWNIIFLARPGMLNPSAQKQFMVSCSLMHSQCPPPPLGINYCSSRTWLCFPPLPLRHALDNSRNFVKSRFTALATHRSPFDPHNNDLPDTYCHLFPSCSEKQKFVEPFSANTSRK